MRPCKPSFRLLMMLSIGITCSIVYLGGCQRRVVKTPSVTKPPAPLEVLKQQFPDSDSANSQSLPFKVHWPPIDPQRSSPKSQQREALLNGQLLVLNGHNESQEPEMRVQIELTRPTSDEARMRWNKQLKFPEYLWMARLRVWDAEREWLWPNVSCLLTAYGIERDERYGGVDPEKNVDNDFAGLVLRSYDHQGNELSQTAQQPLVTANWKPGSDHQTGVEATIKSVVHSAKSDVLQITLTQPEDKQTDPAAMDSGQIRVWLIYADFMHAPPPASWPKEKEFSGGILSYFSIDWKRIGDEIKIESLTSDVPPCSTGVDWQTWCESGKPPRLRSDTISK